MLLAILLAAAAQKPPAHLVVPESVRKEREAEQAAPEPILSDAPFIDLLGPPKPEPGGWAEYAVRTRGAPDVRIRLSILPPALPDGRYWLEADSVAEIGIGSAVKMRVRGNPSDAKNIDRMYLWVAGQAPITIPLDQLPQQKSPRRLPGKVVREKAEVVTVKAGEFEAEPLRLGKSRVWRSPKVPLWGVVKAQTPRQTVELLGYGQSGAHSTFPPGFADDQNQGNGSESTK